MILEIRGYETPPFTLTTDMLSASIPWSGDIQPMNNSLSIQGTAGSTLSNNWNSAEPYSCSCIKAGCERNSDGQMGLWQANFGSSKRIKAVLVCSKYG